MMNILIVLLGCHIPFLLNDRINTAVQFAETQHNTKINWFLSGGIKNPNEDTITEAAKMATLITEQKNIYMSNQLTWSYLYDTLVRNTAENFIMVQQYLNETSIDYDEVYIVTSDFHFERAEKIAEAIIDKKVSWILSDGELHDSRYWEKIHIRNVMTDVNKAITEYSRNVPPM